MDDKRDVIPPRKGLMHLVDATGYSIQGFRRLMQESAAWHEVVAGALGVVALALRGASVGQIAVFIMLILALLAVEALNTAIEEVVDHLSPGWSLMAKNAKDLGSLAVGLTVAITVIHVALAMIWPG